MVKIKKIEAYHLNIPLKFSFEHSKASRKETDNFICKATLENGIEGYGEGIPRDYVTGETHDIFLNGLKAYFKKLMSISPSSLEGLVEILDKHETIVEKDYVCTSSKACLELSLLDAYGKYFNESIGDIGKYFGFSNNQNNCTYSTVIGSGSIKSAVSNMDLGLTTKMRDFKIKLGQFNDLRKIKKIYKKYRKEIESGEIRLRGDTNSLWNLEKAKSRISKLAKYKLCYIEDPLKNVEDYKELNRISDILIMLDEPLRTFEEAKRFIENNMCKGFDIRVSKNGGLIDSLKIAKLAKENNIDCQVGCMVGETGILTAAGRHLIYNIGPIFTEGSYGNLFLENDIIKEELTLTIGGKINKLNNPGLGITIKDRQFRKYTKKIWEYN